MLVDIFRITKTVAMIQGVEDTEMNCLRLNGDVEELLDEMCATIRSVWAISSGSTWHGIIQNTHVAIEGPGKSIEQLTEVIPKIVTGLEERDCGSFATAYVRHDVSKPLSVVLGPTKPTPALIEAHNAFSNGRWMQDVKDYQTIGYALRLVFGGLNLFEVEDEIAFCEKIANATGIDVEHVKEWVMFDHPILTVQQAMRLQTVTGLLADYWVNLALQYQLDLDSFDITVQKELFDLWVAQP